MRTLVTEGHVDPAHYVQIGLRGCWPGGDVFAWQAEQGISAPHGRGRPSPGHRPDRRRRRSRAIGHQARVRDGGHRRLDPAFAPRTGTPEAGGLLPRELIAAVRTLGSELESVGCRRGRDRARRVGDRGRRRDDRGRVVGSRSPASPSARPTGRIPEPTGRLSAGTRQCSGCQPSLTLACRAPSGRRGWRGRSPARARPGWSPSPTSTVTCVVDAQVDAGARRCPRA